MIACEGGRCSVQGPITVNDVVALLGEGNERFTAQEVTVDLAAVTDVDSSALSLLLEWRREAGRNGRAIRYLNLPANLKSLAELYGVTEFVGAA
jgi:phospholipid transport system transporter-binding protein